MRPWWYVLQGIRVGCVTAGMCGVLTTTTMALGQTQPGGDEIPRVFSVRVTYYECIDPQEEPPCACTTEGDRNQCCPDCEEWLLKAIDQRVPVDFAVENYMFASEGSSAAARFIRDFANVAYGPNSFPTLPDGSPIPPREMYNSFAEYGWTELDPQQERVGAIAVWSDHAGVVLDDGVSVLHPSDSLGGRLTTGIVDGVRLEAPRYLVPVTLLDGER